MELKFCSECLNAAPTSHTYYVCSQGHRRLLHRSCIKLYRTCKADFKMCDHRIVGVENLTKQGEEAKLPPSAQARGYYKRLHTQRLKEKIYGANNSNVNHRMAEKGLLQQTEFAPGHWGHTRKAGVTSAQLEEGQKEVMKELEMEWKETKQCIEKWFKEDIKLPQ